MIFYLFSYKKTKEIYGIFIDIALISPYNKRYREGKLHEMLHFWGRQPLD